MTLMRYIIIKVVFAMMLFGSNVLYRVVDSSDNSVTLGNFSCVEAMSCIVEETDEENTEERYQVVFRVTFRTGTQIEQYGPSHSLAEASNLCSEFNNKFGELLSLPEEKIKGKMLDIML